LLSLPRKY